MFLKWLYFSDLAILQKTSKTLKILISCWMSWCSFDLVNRQNILLSKHFHYSVFGCVNNLIGGNALWIHYLERQYSMSHQSTETSSGYILHGESYVEFLLSLRLNNKMYMHASSLFRPNIVYYSSLPHFLEGHLCRLQTHHRWLSDHVLLLEPMLRVHQPMSSAASSNDQSLP